MLDLDGDADHEGHVAEELVAAGTRRQQPVDVDAHLGAVGIVGVALAVAVAQRDDAASQRVVDADDGVDAAGRRADGDGVALGEVRARRRRRGGGTAGCARARPRADAA